jgi:SSS family solute:Na+ symporter
MNSLRTPDLVVIAIYFIAVAAIGLRFARRQTTTEAYFVANRTIPHWAMGLSIFATIISSISSCPASWPSAFCSSSARC